MIDVLIVFVSLHNSTRSVLIRLSFNLIIVSASGKSKSSDLIPL